jgi:hypothetical protein
MTWKPWGRLLKRLSLLTAACAVALATSASASRADFVSSDTGNTETRNASGTVDGTYNFAVLDRTTGGIAGDEFGAVVNPRATSPSQRFDPYFDSRFVAGTGSGALDTSARYLYLFQIVNNGTGTDALRVLETSLGSTSDITSWGYFGAPGKAVGAGDDLGPVSLTNDLGNNAPDFEVNGMTTTGVSRPHVTSDGSYVVPVHMTLTPNGTLVTAFDTGSPATNELAAGHESVLIGFTSNVAPHLSATGSAFRFGNGAGGWAYGGGALPMPMPEPSAIALVGIGLACVALLYWRRRNRIPKAVALA